MLTHSGTVRASNEASYPIDQPSVFAMNGHRCNKLLTIGGADPENVQNHGLMLRATQRGQLCNPPNFFFKIGVNNRAVR